MEISTENVEVFLVLEEILLDFIQLVSLFMVMVVTMNRYKRQVIGDRGISNVIVRMENLDRMINRGDIVCVDQLRMDRNTFGMEQEDIAAEVAGSQSVTQTPNDKNATKQGGRKRVRGNDIMATELGNMSKAISKFCEDSNDKMQVLCTRIGYQYDVTESRKKIYGEIEKLDNLGMSDKLKAVTMIANDIGKMDVFFSLPNEFKAEWVALLLRREL